ncbi:hydrogen peroxide-inducible genes activator [Hansschlegelia quercus]|uniref:Hydrogen peroxide-inducible genes activator n=1 Tax=Hansschlegelia quercus TaxID=2528245 RepID=A0A4Q9GFL2_9HYPH|nr:hydrogen peroxide-inducible genes activator [Hansschlegelia quercus]TBN51741.1 hydrogen peroxide-inducible genes activator [Hansschlegelia quercus]
MSNLTLKQFRYFEALTQHGHFGRASEACAITQPALSMQIKAMEEELGAALFERNSREIRLTSFGAEVALRTRSILQALDDLDGYARASRGGSTWRLRIGVIPTVAPYLLPSLVSDLTRLHEGLDLHVRETLTPKLVQELNEGRLDMAIVALPVSEPTLTEMVLFTEDFVFVRPRKDEGKPVPSREALREMRLLLLEEGHCFREQALAFCNKNVNAAKPRDLLDASSLSTLVQMVEAGLGVTLIPELAIPLETRSAAVSIAQFAEPRPTRTIGMVWRKSSPLAARFTEIADFVGKSVAAL